jgi:hypothetical protein
MTKINQLTVLRKSAMIGLSSIVLSALSLPAQAIEFVQNGGFVPSGLSSPSAYVGGGQVNIPNWNLASSGYTFLISDGTTYTTDINAANYGLDPVFGTPITAPSGAAVTLYGSAPVNSPTGSGWYLASDGAYGVPAIISQTINGLTAGQNYTLSFYQASAQQKEFTGDTTDFFTVNFGSSTQNSATMNHASQAAVSAWQQQTMSFTADNSTQLLSFIAQGAPNGQPPFALLSGVSLQDVTPVPFESDALPVVGSTVIFGLGLWAKQKFAQKKLT